MWLLLLLLPVPRDLFGCCHDTAAAADDDDDDDVDDVDVDSTPELA